MIIDIRVWTAPVITFNSLISGDNNVFFIRKMELKMNKISSFYLIKRKT